MGSDRGNFKSYKVSANQKLILNGLLKCPGENGETSNDGMFLMTPKHSGASSTLSMRDGKHIINE